MVRFPFTKKNKALCIVCNKIIKCCKTDLRQHSQTVTHMNNIKNQIQSLDNYNKHMLQYKDKIKRAKIKLVVFFVEHNVTFSRSLDTIDERHLY